jgi:hypothetical protein
MKFNTAISALIDQAHARSVSHHIAIPGWENPPTRDEVATGRENIRIAAIVGNDLVSDLLYDIRDELVFGTFDNCREYGITVTVGGWTFSVYEHRNSDDIIVNGCPTADVQPFGPYAKDGDKYDVLFSTRWRNYEGASAALAAAIQRVRNVPGTGREKLKQVIIEIVRANA